MPRTLRSLLLALSLVALCVPTAAVGAESEEVSEISDSRIEESSGLAISAEHEDLAYTINDAGNDPIVYGDQDLHRRGRRHHPGRRGRRSRTPSRSPSTATGRMWVADLGDNDEERDDTALYAFPEPGPGDHSVTAQTLPGVATTVAPSTSRHSWCTRRPARSSWPASRRRRTERCTPCRASCQRTATTAPLTSAKTIPEDTSDGTFTPDGIAGVDPYAGRGARVRPRELVRGRDSWKFPRSSRARASRSSRTASVVPHRQRGQELTAHPGVVRSPGVGRGDPAVRQQEPPAESSDEESERGRQHPDLPRRGGRGSGSTFSGCRLGDPAAPTRRTPLVATGSVLACSGHGLHSRLPLQDQRT